MRYPLGVRERGPTKVVGPIIRGIKEDNSIACGVVLLAKSNEGIALAQDCKIADYHASEDSYVSNEYEVILPWELM